VRPPSVGKPAWFASLSAEGGFRFTRLPTGRQAGGGHRGMIPKTNFLIIRTKCEAGF